MPRIRYILPSTGEIYVLWNRILYNFSLLFPPCQPIAVHLSKQHNVELATPSGLIFLVRFHSPVLVLQKLLRSACPCFIPKEPSPPRNRSSQQLRDGSGKKLGPYDRPGGIRLMCAAGTLSVKACPSAASSPAWRGFRQFLAATQRWSRKVRTLFLSKKDCRSRSPLPSFGSTRR